jgi:hypothetical protein
VGFQGEGTPGEGADAGRNVISRLGLILSVPVNHPIKMSRLQKSHKGFVIQATALRLREPVNHFTVHISIRKDTGDHSDQTLFESGEIFPSENAALEAGFQIGEQKIDTGFQPRNIVANLDELVGLQD